MGFLLLGSLINNDTNTDLVKLKSLLKCNFTRPFEVANGEPLNLSEFAPGFFETAVLVAVAVPLAPLLLQAAPDKGQSWNPIKTHGLASHLLGQSTSFGFSELLRHLDHSPNDLFADRCNLTDADCREKQDKTLRLFSLLETADATRAVCSHPSVSHRQVFDSLHTFPNCLGSMLGAGLVSFFLCLFIWIRLCNGAGRGNPESVQNALQRAAHFGLFLLFSGTLAVFVWGGNPREETLAQKVMSVVQGALWQIVISAIFLTRHQDQVFALIAARATPDNRPQTKVPLVSTVALAPTGKATRLQKTQRTRPKTAMTNNDTDADNEKPPLTPIIVKL